jgi:hypothetical protein
MNLQRFSLLIFGADVLAPDNLDRLYEAGCHDAVFGTRQGMQFAEFARRADSLPAAVHSAMQSVESAVPDARVARIEPDDLVTLTEIAQRVGRTKESVRLLSEGRRGPGGFPTPVAWLAAKQRIWQWSDVAAWFGEQLGETLPLTPSAQFVAALNGALEVRRRAAALDTDDEREIVAALLEREAERLRAGARMIAGARYA